MSSAAEKPVLRDANRVASRGRLAQNLPSRPPGGQRTEPGAAAAARERMLLHSLFRPLPGDFRRRVEAATDAAFLGKCTLKACGEIVHREDVRHFNALAEGPLSAALARLRAAGLSDLVRLLLDLYPRFLPYQIAGVGAGHFPHHAAYVMDHLALILCGEGAGEADFRVGMLAALCHDCGLSRSEGRKITEQEIKRRLKEGYARDARRGPSPAEVEELWRSAVNSRIEHAVSGAAIAGEVLRGCAQSGTAGVNAEEIEAVKNLVLHHDDPKIPGLDRLIQETLGEHWLSANALSGKWFEERRRSGGLIDPGHRLLQWHYEADALWMLTPDGIMADLMRPEFSKRVSFTEMLEHNLKQHGKMVETYRALLANRPAEFERYAFIAGTHYRSRTGYVLFRHLEDMGLEWAAEADESRRRCG